MVVLKVKNITKSFQEPQLVEPLSVLANVSMQFEAPAIISVVGPNGVGKSTFLRLLAGIIEPDSGSIAITSANGQQARIGYVPQSNPIFPWRRVIDDIAIPLEIEGMPRHHRHALVKELLKQFAFDLPLNRRTFGLSGGQRQLINLCRAIVGVDTPSLLLLDEPFASLDPPNREEFVRHLQAIRERCSTLIILTTHQLDYAVRVSDFVVPFRCRPVESRSDSVRAVDIPFPRTIAVRSSKRFHAILETVEALLQTESCERV